MDARVIVLCGLLCTSGFNDVAWGKVVTCVFISLIAILLAVDVCVRLSTKLAGSSLVTVAGLPRRVT
jgi:hypothetical protein